MKYFIRTKDQEAFVDDNNLSDAFVRIARRYCNAKDKEMPDE